MERLGIIGGSFDPIHIAHVYIAEEAQKKLNLDKVVFVPVGSQPLKLNKKVTEASLRFKMVKEAVKGKNGFEVSDYEIQKKGLSYTYQTLEHFKKSNRELFFITGADCLMDLDRWKGVDIIFKLCKLVVLTRPGFNSEDLFKQKYQQENKYGGEIIFLEVPNLDVSSTEIRKRIRDGKDVDDFLDKNVLKIIKEENLYKG